MILDQTMPLNFLFDSISFFLSFVIYLFTTHSVSFERRDNAVSTHLSYKGRPTFESRPKVPANIFRRFNETLQANAEL